MGALRALLVFGLVIGAASGAEAQRTGAVLPFDGRGPAPRLAQRQVHNALDGQVTLVPLDDVASAVDRVGDEPSAVAQELNADLVITGNVRGRGRRARTTIIIYDAQGQEIARETSRGRGQTGSAAQEALGTALGVLEERGAPDEQEPEPPQDFGLGDEQPPEGEGEDEGEPTGNPVVTITGGVTVRARSADVALSMPPNTSRYYSSGPFPEISLRIEAMPLASSTGAGAGLLLRGDFAFASWLESQEEDPMGMPVPLDTSSMRLSLDAGYLASVAETVKLGGLLGFGIDSFSVEANDIMPGRSYSYIRLAPLLRFVLAGIQLYGEVELGLRIGLGTGDLKGTWAAEASAFGYELGGGLGGRLESGLSYAFRIAWISYGLSFTGAGSDPAVQAVDGTDSGYFFTLHGGWSF